MIRCVFLLEEDYKKKIKELIVKYRLEPSITEIFVEGPSDIRLYKWFFDKIGVKNVIVNEINTINFEIEYFAEKDLYLKKNNRNKVIYLAHKLESEDIPTNQIKCIIDADFDNILLRHYDCTLLFITDYSCLEMYLFNIKTLNKLLEMFYYGFPQKPEYIISQFYELLPSIFLIRLTNEILNLKMEWLTIKRCCECKNCEMKFDVKEFIKRYLGLNNNSSKLNEFMDVYNEYKYNMSGDPRKYIHKDDLFEFLSYYIQYCGKKELKLCSEQIIERGLMNSIEIDHIEEENLFKMLQMEFKQ